MNAAGAAAETTVWTIGHSTRPLDEFAQLLVRNGIRTLADVRRFPGSRRHPQYGRPALEAALGEHGIECRWLPALGGRRKPRPDSPNSAWRNAAFRGYADYMQTAEFAGAFAGLIASARAAPTCIMCAEALWWRCHRALIADALCANGFRVLHIMGTGPVVEHPYTSAARIVGGRLSYLA